MSLRKLFKYNVLFGFLAVLLAGCLDEDLTPLKVGAKAPPFVLALVDGKKMDMTRPDGSGHVLTFMASWCPCSNESIPLMKKAYALHKEKGTAFLMIGIQDAESKFEKFVAKWRVPFPAGYDAGNKIARAYGVTAPPTAIFIDGEGTVKRVFYGNIKDKEEAFLQWVRELL